MITWHKTKTGYESNCLCYSIDRDRNRHFTLYGETAVPGEDYICKGTLAKCKEVAQDRVDDAAVTFREIYRACEEGTPLPDLTASVPVEETPNEPTDAEIDAAYDRACTCLSEIEASGNRKHPESESVLEETQHQRGWKPAPTESFNPDALGRTPNDVKKSAIIRLPSLL